MMRSHTLWRLFIRYRVCCPLLLTAVIGSGCGGPLRPKLAPVSGIVLYNGKAIEGAVVEFVREKLPVRSMGSTDDSGQFALTTFAPGDGAPIGEYQVTVTKRTLAEESEEDLIITPPEDIKDSAAKAELWNQRMARTVDTKVAAQAAAKKARNLLPAKYADPKTSGLEFEVKDGVPNEFQIVLTD